jgi:hypothetical protein
MDIGFQAAAKGAPEMSFWPTAVAILTYPSSPSFVYSVFLLVIMFGGSMTYLGMRNVKSMLDDLQGKTSTRQRVGRNDESLLRRRKIRDLAEFTRDTLPNNSVAFIIALILVGFNILAGAFFLFDLLIRSPEAIGSKPAIRAAVALPIVYFFVLCSIIIWNY